MKESTFFTANISLKVVIFSYEFNFFCSLIFSLAFSFAL